MDKPLHVRVAEALGWTEVIPFSVYGVADGSWCGDKPGSGTGEDHDFVPRYDTDWSATGPLIEKYGIEILRGGSMTHPSKWTAYANGISNMHDDAPLIAVCHLILELKKAGKI